MDRILDRAEWMTWLLMQIHADFVEYIVCDVVGWVFVDDITPDKRGGRSCCSYQRLLITSAGHSVSLGEFGVGSCASVQRSGSGQTRDRGSGSTRQRTTHRCHPLAVFL